MYRALLLNELLVDHPVSFDLFLKYKNGQVAVFTKAGMHFSDQKRTELLNNNVDMLYIRSDDEKKLLEYHARTIHELLKNPDMTSDERAKLLHTSMNDHMQHLFDDGISQTAVTQCKEFIKSMVSEIVSNRVHTEALLKLTARDFDTYSHCVNVAIYSLALGKSHGMDEKHLVQLGAGALLHDVGKTRIDLAIINKPGVLTKEEYQAIKKHPDHGYEILRSMGESDDTILNIVRYHHEKLDGSGYGRGLAGEEIDTEIKIVTIADIFDALSTNRSYKQAASHFTCFKTMKVMMKDQLDMTLVDSLIRLMGKVA